MTPYAVFLPLMLVLQQVAMRRVGVGPGAGRVGCLAVVPGFVVYAVLLTAHEKFGAPAWLPWLGVPALLAGYAIFVPRRVPIEVARALGFEPGEAELSRFEAVATRLAPWPEPPERTRGFVARAPGVLRVRPTGAGGGESAFEPEVQEDGAWLLRSGATSFRLTEIRETPL